MNRRGFLNFLGIAPVALPAAMAMPAATLAKGGWFPPGWMPLRRRKLEAYEIAVDARLHMNADLFRAEIMADFGDRQRINCRGCKPAPLWLPIPHDEISEAHT